MGGMAAANPLLYHRQPIKPTFDQLMLKFIAKLTLVPSRDEILPVRSQEPVDQCLLDEKKLAKFLEFHWAWSLTKTDNTKYLQPIRAKDFKSHKFSENTH